MFGLLRFALSILAVSILAVGCASISIDAPKNLATDLDMPQPLHVTTKGKVDFGYPSIDGFNLSRYNGQNFQYLPQTTLRFVPSGQHILDVPAKDGTWGTNISESSVFSVKNCPQCYSCPVGVVHQVTGQCCDNGSCDINLFSNFGLNWIRSSQCMEAVFPGSSKHWDELYCISSSPVMIKGTAVTAPQMLAVSFTVASNRNLRQIQVPVGYRSGGNNLRVWIAEDSGNQPGTILESILVSNVREFKLGEDVNSPIHIFSTVQPRLTAGSKYWLVLGAGQPDTVIYWNYSLKDVDVSIPGNTTYLKNTTTSIPSGPWVAISHLVERRPAFEIDVR